MGLRKPVSYWIRMLPKTVNEDLREDALERPEVSSIRKDTLHHLFFRPTFGKEIVLAFLLF